MKTEKIAVLDFLANLPSKPAEQFNEALNLYRKAPGAHSNQIVYFNRVGYNTSSLASVLYELQRVFKITKSDIKKHKDGDAKQNQKPNSLFSKFIEGLANIDEAIATKLIVLMKFAYDFNFVGIETIEGMSEVLVEYLSDTTPYELYKENNPGLIENLDSIADQDFINLLNSTSYPEEYLEEITALKPKVISFEEDINALKQVFVNAPEEVKQEIRFRDQFPFLKEGNYPEEFKALITEKFDHYYAYVDAHEALVQKVFVNHPDDAKLGDNQELFLLAKEAVANFVADQLIWDELDYYQKNNKVLGKHPVFAERKLQEKVNEMSMAAAAKRKTNLENYIGRDQKKADEAKAANNEADFAKFSEKVVEWKSELVLINLKLDDKK